MPTVHEEAVPGKLRLKKKKKKTEKTIQENEKEAEAPAEAKPKAAMTKAEAAFERRQAILRAERVKKRAQTSHREKVAKLNEHLDNLTELNDIPKVSWTK